MTSRSNRLILTLRMRIMQKGFARGNIDAIITMTGHSSVSTNFITHARESDSVTVDSDKIELLLQYNPRFHKVTLEKEKYPGITT